MRTNARCAQPLSLPLSLPQITNKTLGDKLQNNDFLSSINNYDFVVLTEIWNRSQIEIPGYNNFTTSPTKTNSTGRQSGGITFLFKNRFQNGSKVKQYLVV